MTAEFDMPLPFANDPEAALQEIKDHLLIAPLPVWADVLRRSDTDRHHDLIAWMIDQPECDATVAQLAFYKFDPATQLERRIAVDPDAPHRDALCKTIANHHAEGRYQTAEIGLLPGELETEMAVLATLLEALPAQERVFATPSVFLHAPDIPAVPVEDVWSAEHDDHIRLLYEAAGLIVLKGSSGTAATSERGPASGSIIVRGLMGALSMFRRPKLASAK